MILSRSFTDERSRTNQKKTALVPTINKNNKIATIQAHRIDCFEISSSLGLEPAANKSSIPHHSPTSLRSHRDALAT